MDTGEQPSFPQFAQLPTELRLRVWHLFCGEIGSGPRVFSVKLATEVSQITGDVPYSIQPSDSLKHQTALARAALAVNREARGEALKLVPDTFTVNDGSSLVNFQAKHDIVLLDGEFNAPWMRNSWNHHIEGFTDQIINLALGTDFMAFRAKYLGRNIDESVHTTWFLLMFLNPFTRLETVYYCWDDQRERYLKRWCASDLVNRYHFLPDRESASGSGLEQVMYCWLGPHPVGPHGDASMEDLLFTSDCGPMMAELRIKVNLLLKSPRWSQDKKTRIRRIIEPLSEDDLWRLSKIGMRKMIIFLSSDGLRRFNALDVRPETPT
ncbi:hypothetical protein SLS53_008238 [Cytospora paraplurivora]|uniref:2EXR domain-containing protein n=1 Tax=Cytospora paraplurivora TaxID=2898453 RepID=A0AAN9TYA2_9PEZI